MAGWRPSDSWAPELKAESDRIFNHDRERFKKLVHWVMQGRKQGHSDHDLAEALRRFWAGSYYIAIELEWWPFLDRILENLEKKADKDKIRALEAEHERRKAAEADWLEKKREAKG